MAWTKELSHKAAGFFAGKSLTYPSFLSAGRPSRMYDLQYLRLPRLLRPPTLPLLHDFLLYSLLDYRPLLLEQVLLHIERRRDPYVLLTVIVIWLLFPIVWLSFVILHSSQGCSITYDTGYCLLCFQLSVSRTRTANPIEAFCSLEIVRSKDGGMKIFAYEVHREAGVGPPWRRLVCGN